MSFATRTDQEILATPLIFIAGPTAIGKTELALTLAEEFGCEIIGVDSMQIYRHMDIGTAKPSVSERGRVPHHLIDYVSPDEEYSASRFVTDCQGAIAQIRAKGRLPLLVGGTGLYFAVLEQGIFAMPEISPEIRAALQEELATRGREALWQELAQRDAVTAGRIHANDTYRLLRALEIVRSTGKSWSAFIADQQKERSSRPESTVLKIGLSRDREELYQRIEQRVEMMMSAGLLAEVERLLQLGYSGDLRPMQSLGYRHMLNYLDGQWDWDQARSLLARDTRRYAKRQLTWFRADPAITWFQPFEFSAISATIASFVKGVQS